MDLYKHASDDALEAYILRTLPEMEVAPFEMHVLVCPLCLVRLAETVEFVTAMRAAAAEFERERDVPGFRADKGSAASPDGQLSLKNRD